MSDPGERISSLATSVLQDVDLAKRLLTLPNLATPVTDMWSRVVSAIFFLNLNLFLGLRFTAGITSSIFKIIFKS